MFKKILLASLMLSSQVQCQSTAPGMILRFCSTALFGAIFTAKNPTFCNFIDESTNYISKTCKSRWEILRAYTQQNKEDQTSEQEVTQSAQEARVEKLVDQQLSAA